MPTVWEKIYTLRYGTDKSLFGRSLLIMYCLTHYCPNSVLAILQVWTVESLEDILLLPKYPTPYLYQ